MGDEFNTRLRSYRKQIQIFSTRYYHFQSVSPIMSFSDGTQPFDLIPPSQQTLQHDDGNLRLQTPVVLTNEHKTEPAAMIPSKILRPSGRLSHLNQNRTSEYQGTQLPGVGNLRDPLLERRIKRDRAATKIQAVYRGHTVRKSIHWLNEKQQRLKSEFNKRVCS